MSKVTSIEGIRNIPFNEMPDRGANVPRSLDYIPFATMTTGQFDLSLLRQDIITKAGLYPEYKEYSRAKMMVDNALRGQINTTGVYADSVTQYVGKKIMEASKKGGGVSGLGITIPDRIGDLVVDLGLGNCDTWALAKLNDIHDRDYTSPPPLSWGNSWDKTKRKHLEYFLDYLLECKQLKDIEQILNAGILKTSHHMLYKDLKSAATWPNRVDTKRILHEAGVQSLGRVGDLATSKMNEFIEVAIKRQNAIVGVGDLSSQQSALLLSQTPEQYEAQIGVVSVVLLTKLVIALTAAIAAASTLVNSLSAKKAGAFATAQGFGTEAYSAQKEDWDKKTPENSTDTDGGNNIMLISAAALGVYFLTNK
jgi:hypothetical protein